MPTSDQVCFHIYCPILYIGLFNDYSVQSVNYRQLTSINSLTTMTDAAKYLNMYTVTDDNIY